MNAIETAFTLAFEKSPILLCNGIASEIPGRILPIIALTEGMSIASGLLKGDMPSLDSLSVAFMPSPGGTLIAQEISEYPFLNQATAANATVKKPNRIAMTMLKPATTRNGGYAAKTINFTSLKMSLDRHNASGGTYAVLTPACIYSGCVMRSMIDISSFSDQTKQVQYAWSFEFEQPLLQISQLDAVMGTLMSKISGGVKPAGELSWSGVGNAIAAEFIY